MIQTKEQVRALNAPAHAHQEANDSADQKYDEQHLRNTSGAHGDTTEPEEGCNQRDDEKYYCIVEHVRTCICVKNFPNDGSEFPRCGAFSQSAAWHITA